MNIFKLSAIRLWPKRTLPTVAPHLALGKWGEKVAANYIKQCGYRIVASNFIAPIGHSQNGAPISGEIDMIAYDESASPYVLSFLEVKTRSGKSIALPEAAITRQKQRQIIKVARAYRRIMGLDDVPYRFDAISVLLEDEEDMVLTLHKGYFTDNIRHKRS